jgi:hypothetical protein
MKKLYAQRDPEELDKAGAFYAAHIMAMTEEDLYSKSDIAAELAYRDAITDQLKRAVAVAVLELRQHPSNIRMILQDLEQATKDPEHFTVGAREERSS